MSDDGNDSMVPVPTINQRMEFLENHIRDLTDLVNQIVRTLDAYESKLDRIERKTHSLSDRPASNICSNCHKIVHSTGNCEHCGTRRLQ